MHVSTFDLKLNVLNCVGCINYIYMFVLTLLFVSFFQAQSPSDSLKAELAKEKSPEKRSTLYYQLARTVYGSDQDLAILYADSAFQEAKNAGSLKQQANALNVKGVSQLIKSEFDQSMASHLEALKIREQIQDTTGMVESYVNIGNILYRTSKSYDASLQYKKGVRLARMTDNSRALSLLYNNLGSYFRDRWKSTDEKIDYDSAMYYLGGALEMKTKLSDKSGMINTLGMLTELAQAEGKFQEAENFLKQVLEISETTDNKELQISAKVEMGDFLLENGSPLRALPFFLSAHEIAKSMDSKFQTTHTLGYLAEVYVAMGNYPKAVEYYKQKVEADWKLQNESNQKLANDLLIKYETEKKELENQRLLEEQRFLDLDLQRKNEQLIAVGLAFLILIGIYFWQRKKKLELAKAHQDLNQLLAQTQEQHQQIELQAKALEQSNQALKESNRIRERLFSVISHDLKTPISTLQTGLEYWSDDTLSQQEFQAILPKIITQTETVRTLMENLLEWSQAQLDYSKISISEVDLHGLVQELIGILKQTSESKGLNFVNEIPEGHLINTDQDRLAFILRNLISNAIKYTPSGGTVSLGLDPDHRHSIYVADTGIGMSQEQISALFSGKITSKKGTKGEKGTGIGLILCKEFAESIGARLKVRSQENQGSVFTILMD